MIVSLISLSDISENTQNEPENRQKLLPDVEIFKEIMVELIRNKEIDIDALKKEKREYIQDAPGEFQLNEMILKIVEENPKTQDIRKVEIYRIEDGNTVVFDHVINEKGEEKSIRCSNVLIRIVKNEE